MRRRLRVRRRRIAALVFGPVTLLAATTTISASAQTAAGPELETHRDRAGFGKVLRLRGSGAGPGSSIAIEFRRNGGSNWSRVKRTQAGEGGAFRAKARARYSGYWRAVPAGGTASEAVKVRVRARVSLRGPRHEVVGGRARLKGRVRPAGPRRQVRVRIAGRTLKTRANRKGKYSLRWRAARPGRFRPRAKVGGDRLAAGAKDRGRRITVYRPAKASWYGPGFYGNRTACGRTLTPGTVGVAHKRLPCGTKVRFRHRGRTVTAPVIDRGPYAHGREFDLTAETRERLRFGSTGTVLSSK